MNLKAFTNKQHGIAETLMTIMDAEELAIYMKSNATPLKAGLARLIKSGDAEATRDKTAARLTQQGVNRLLLSADYSEANMRDADNILRKYIKAADWPVADDELPTEEETAAVNKADAKRRAKADKDGAKANAKREKEMTAARNKAGREKAGAVIDAAQATVDALADDEEGDCIGIQQGQRIAQAAFGTKFFPARLVRTELKSGAARFTVEWHNARTGQSKQLAKSDSVEGVLLAAALLTGRPLDLSAAKAVTRRGGGTRARMTVMGYTACGFILWLARETKIDAETIPALFEVLGATGCPVMQTVKSQVRIARMLADGLDVSGRNYGKHSEVTKAHAKTIRTAIKALS